MILIIDKMEIRLHWWARTPKRCWPSFLQLVPVSSFLRVMAARPTSFRRPGTRHQRATDKTASRAGGHTLQQAGQGAHECCSSFFNLGTLKRRNILQSNEIYHYLIFVGGKKNFTSQTLPCQEQRCTLSTENVRAQCNPSQK